jgi:hypothetical protein
MATLRNLFLEKFTSDSQGNFGTGAGVLSIEAHRNGAATNRFKIFHIPEQNIMNSQHHSSTWTWSQHEYTMVKLKRNNEKSPKKPTTASVV